MVQSDKPSLRPLILGAVGFVAITLLLTVGINAIGIGKIREFIDSAGPLAPLAYIFVRAITNVIAPLNGGPLSLGAGIGFGLWEGTLYSVIGETLGGSINFIIARKLGRPYVQRLVGKSGMGKVEQFYRQVGQPTTLIFARLFLFAAYDFVSYAAGLTTIKYVYYLVITVVGGLITNAIFVAVGTSLTGSPSEMLGMYAVLAVITVLALVLYGRVRHWLKVDAAVTEQS